MVTFTEEILNGKLYFLRSACRSFLLLFHKIQITKVIWTVNNIFLTRILIGTTKV